MENQPKNENVNSDSTQSNYQRKGLQLLAEMANVDVCIFSDTESVKCRRPSTNQLLTECCPSLSRLFAASRLFEAITNYSEIKEEKKKSILVEFCSETYVCLLDDVTHLVQGHSNDINQFHEEWTQRYALSKCTVTECAKTARHYRRGNSERMKRKEDGNEQDALYDFYESEFDKVHNFVFHLYDLGLRVDTSSLTLNQEEDDEKESELKGVKVDKLFAAERKHIKMRRKENNVNSERMNSENNKYTMQMIATKKCSITLMDALFEKIAKMKDVRKQTMQRMKMYFHDNLYDSDCIEMDIEDFNDSNIYRLVESQFITETMRKFIRAIRCMLFVFHSISSSKTIYSEAL